MADLIKVDIITLEQDIKNLQEMLEKAKSEIESMYGSVRELGKTWTGKAHDAFAGQFARDKQVLYDTIEIVDAVLNSMEQAKKEYRNCEQSIQAEIEKIRIG